MIFHKSVWNKTKFKEKSIIFDRLFSSDILAKGGRIGIAKGFYIFHLYRWDKENPLTYNNHLF